MNKICFIQTPVMELKDDRLDPPMGLLYMATMLKDHGWDVSVCDLSGKNLYDYLEVPFAHYEHLGIPYAKYYGFSTYTTNYHLTVRLKEWIKRQCIDSIMIAGGPHASALPNEVIKDFDYVVVGEGEIAIQEILEGRHQKGSVVKAETISDLDNLPFVDFSFVKVDSYHRHIQGQKALPIQTSRGCPYHCSFCASFRGYRKRSPMRVADEMRSMLEKYGDIRFRIAEDLFGRDVDWLIEFGKVAPIMKYDCFIRADYDIRIPMLLKKSGCTLVSIGIESGSDLILKNMGKRTSANVNRQGIKGLKDVGIQVLTWIIVGFPGETWDTVKETVDFINETVPDIVIVSPLVPYPGADVWNHPEKYGMRILDKNFSHYFHIRGNYEADYVYETDTLNPTIIKEMRQYIIDNIRNSEVR